MNGGLCTSWACEGKISPILQHTTQSVSDSSWSLISSGWPTSSLKCGVIGYRNGKVSVRPGGESWEWLQLQNSATQFVLVSAQTSQAGQSHQKSGGWDQQISQKGEAPIRLMGKWNDCYTIWSLIPPESDQTSTPQPRLLIPQQDIKSTGWSERKSIGWGYCILPGQNLLGGSALAKKDGVCGVVEELSSGILAAVSSPLFPEPQSSICSHMTLVCSVLSPPEPRVSGCGRDFGLWPVKMLLWWTTLLWPVKMVL